MPPIPTADSGTFRNYSKTAGSEPLPGYKLLSPLGRGGFGEVWKCEAPGGLHKAIKFVGSESEDGRGDERFGQELAAFEQIKAIRHPFLLTLERVEQIDGELVMVMELADRQLQDRFRECQTCGLTGIPRDELLSYFADAAEALDIISAKHGLQHLDIKPANLFLVAGHVKVGDYGLVAQLEGPNAGNRGLTPRYVAPEVLQSVPSKYSDQYSLALVYVELLTGGFPYSGRTPQQLMLQHVSVAPNLGSLPVSDQPVVARALAKKPEERFASCLAFVQALMSAGVETATPAAAMNLRRARVDRSVAEMTPPPAGSDYPGNAPSERSVPTQPAGAAGTPESTENFTLPSKTHVTLPGRPALPALVSNKQPRLSTGVIHPPPQAAVEIAPVEEEPEAGMVVLDLIRSVMPVGRLLGVEAEEAALSVPTFVSALVEAATAGGKVPFMPGDIGRLADGTWVCQFPSTVPASVVPLKLIVVREHWGVTIEQPDPLTVVLRRVVGGGGFFGGKKYGFEVTIQLAPPNKPVGEVTVYGRLFGATEAKLAREAHDIIPKVLGEVRGQLGNVDDRRKYPRIECDLPVTLYPVHSDGGIDAALSVRCRDVSQSGVGLLAPSSLPTKYVYLVFPTVPLTAEHAILVRLMRVHNVTGGRLYGAQFRTDF